MAGTFNYDGFKFINCTCNYEDGETLVIGKDIVINANNGYEFLEGEYDKDNDYDWIYFNKVKIGNSIDNFNFQPTKLTLQINNFRVDKDITLIEDIEPPVFLGTVEELNTFTNLYYVTNEEISDLAKNRFEVGVDTIVDYGQFIISLYRLPIELSPDMLAPDKKKIVLGTRTSSVDSTIINNFIYTFDGGEIEVPLKYNNAYDYINTECILHLPFLDKLYLNSEYVINQTLSIEYVVDLYSSNVVANVRSSFNNEIIATARGIIGISMPFIQRSNNTVVNTINNVYNNQIKRCFIEVNRNIPYTNESNIFGSGVVEYGKIGDYEGYLQCDNIKLETGATKQEQEEIKSLLSQGVFI